MVLVVVSVAVAFVVGLTFIAVSTTTTSVASTMCHHAQARQIADAGVLMANRYMQQTPSWRTLRPSGEWFGDFSILGGTVAVSGVFDATPAETPLTVSDFSFEQEVASLSTPLLNPPMSGTIGGWAVERTAALQTGLTVPLIDVANTASATDGSRAARIIFGVNVQGAGLFRQTLPDPLVPNTNYVMWASVGRSALASVLADVELRVYVGGTLVVSSVTPSIFSAFTSNGDPSVLSNITLDAVTQQLALRFSTDNAPPAGLVSIELRAASLVGVISEVIFDNVQLAIEEYTSVTLTVTGRYGNASHIVTATIAQPIPARATSILKWSEP